MTAPLPSGSPIRVPRDLWPCAPPPGLSRLAAPFVVSLRQGIRRAPCISCPRSPAGAPCDYPCFSMYDMMDVAIGSGGTPLAGRRHSRFKKCRCLLSLSDRKDRLKSDGESIFEIVPVPRRDGSRRFLLAMRLSRYAGRTPGTGYRGVRGQRGTGGLDAAPGTRHTGYLFRKSFVFLGLLPRKEVIQPHVPVRLPCYDFTPLALHTFDASLTRLGRRLRVQTTRVV